MLEKEDPVIEKCAATENWTCVTFKPDLHRFGVEALETDMVDLMKKRVYDMAAVMGNTVKVTQCNIV